MRRSSLLLCARHKQRLASTSNALDRTQGLVSPGAALGESRLPQNGAATPSSENSAGCRPAAAADSERERPRNGLRNQWNIVSKSVQPLLALQFSTTSSQSDRGAPPLSEADFHRLADRTLHLLHEAVDALADGSEAVRAYDSDLSQGVLTLDLGPPHGTFVLNKQTPNRQLWLSSPVSGPSRFDWLPGAGWVYVRRQRRLRELLAEELAAAFGEPVTLPDDM